MEPMYYIGLDVRKRKIAYSVRTAVARCTPKDRFPPPAWTWTYP
jgi:hypothetical protein